MATIVSPHISAGKTMADRSGLKLVGFLFATVTVAVMLTTTMVVMSYAGGVYTLDSAQRPVAAGDSFKCTDRKAPPSTVASMR